MSIKLMTFVFDGFPAAGSEMLIMLALTDWADDNGGSLYPSVKAVGEKARVGEKHARNILHKFVKERFLAVVGNHEGGKAGTTRQYRLNVAKLKVLADEANAKKDAEKAAKYGKKNAVVDPFENLFDTPPLEVTPNLQLPDASPGGDPYASPTVTMTPPLEVTLTTNEPSIVLPLNTGKVKKLTFVLPEWVNQNHWDVWNLHPKRKNLSDAQKQIALEQLDEWRQAGLDYAQALKNSAVNNYQGIFLPDKQNDRRKNERDKGSIAEQNKASTDLARQKLFGNLTAEKDITNEATAL